MIIITLHMRLLLDMGEGPKLVRSLRSVTHRWESGTDREEKHRDGSSSNC